MAGASIISLTINLTLFLEYLEKTAKNWGILPDTKFYSDSMTSSKKDLLVTVLKGAFDTNFNPYIKGLLS